MPTLLYFVGPKRPSGNCLVNCFLTDRTALSVMYEMILRYNDLNEHQIFGKFSSTYLPELVGFQTMVILNLYCIFFHAVIVFALEFDLLFKYCSTYCISANTFHGNYSFLNF